MTVNHQSAQDDALTTIVEPLDTNDPVVAAVPAAEVALIRPSDL